MLGHVGDAMKNASERKLLSKALPVPKTVAERIRHKRLASGMSQTELAAAIGVKRGAISHYEAGNKEMTARHLSDLATALGCTMDWLYSGTVKR